MREPHTTITLEEMLRAFGPRKLLGAIARTCESLAAEDTAGLWPMWVQAADVLVETSTQACHSAPLAWTRKLVS